MLAMLLAQLVASLMCSDCSMLPSACPLLSATPILAPLRTALPALSISSANQDHAERASVKHHPSHSFLQRMSAFHKLPSVCFSQYTRAATNVFLMGTTGSLGAASPIHIQHSQALKPCKAALKPNIVFLQRRIKFSSLFDQVI